MPRQANRYLDGDRVYGYKLKPFNLARELLSELCALYACKTEGRDICRKCPLHFTYANAFKMPIARIISREAGRIVQCDKDLHRVHRSTKRLSGLPVSE
jgi:hypothetical protein